MDSITRAEIVATVERTVRECLEGADEVWLTKEQLCQQFGMLNEDWVNRNGELLPRERAEIVMKDGTRKATRWAYPRNKIQRMIKEQKLKNLRIGG